MDDAAARFESLRRLFGVFTAGQGRERSEVYATLSQAVAGDDRLLELVMGAPPDQRRPSLMFAAVNSLLAGDPTAELRAYYPIHGGDRPVDDGLVPAFTEFCGRHRAALEDLLRHRSTQTNEIRRCIALRLGLNHISRLWPEPVNLVEVGTSAGLNLVFDRYAYRIGGREVAADPGSGVVVSSEVRGRSDGVLSWDAGSAILGRLGIDQLPVDLADPDACRWLEAFIWPEQVAELATLRAAIETYLTADVGVRLVRGDAVTDTARLVAELPGDEPVVVFTASLLSYLSPDHRRGFADQLRSISRNRRVAWLFAEAPALLVATGINTTGLSGPLSRVTSAYAVGVSLRDGANQDDRMLALADPYLRWLVPARIEDDDFRWVEAEGLI